MRNYEPEGAEGAGAEIHGGVGGGERDKGNNACMHACLVLLHMVARRLKPDFHIVYVWPFGLLDYGSATLRCKI